MGRVGWLLAVIYASGTAAFIPAFKMTSIANVALIWASAPVLAATLAWLWFRQTVSTGFAVATAMVVLGTSVIVWANCRSEPSDRRSSGAVDDRHDGAHHDSVSVFS